MAASFVAGSGMVASPVIAALAVGAAKNSQALYESVRAIRAAAALAAAVAFSLCLVHAFTAPLFGAAGFLAALTVVVIAYYQRITPADECAQEPLLADAESVRLRAELAALERQLQEDPGEQPPAVS